MGKSVMDKGIFTLSLDIELLWGTVHWEGKTHEQSILKERGIIDQLLNLFERYEIKTTAAFVGHLFLEECEFGTTPHPSMPRPKYKWLNYDWYKFDPILQKNKDPLYYGRDIVDKMIDNPIKHEIACHSFSHIIFGEEGCDEGLADAELKECQKLAKDNFGLKLKSLVFPQNEVGHLEILKKNGFTSFRGKDGVWYKNQPKILKKALHPLDLFLALDPPTYKPTQTIPGLWNIPGSMIYLSCDGIRNLIPINARVETAKKGIKKAIERNEIFHLWFHPFNLATKMGKMIDGLEEIFKYVNEKRETGELEVLTMEKITKNLE